MIRRIRFRNWRGIAAREVVIGAGGVLIEGTNGSGKTSFISGIRAALMGRGVDETAVHVGTDEAELLVDLDHATVRRVLKANGSGGLSITLDDGTKQSSPQAWLNDLLGIAPLDPIDLFEERDPTKRRAKVLAAMPISVTPEVLAQWLPPGEAVTKAECAGHGLDVVERLRKAVYERRTEAGRDVKARAATVTEYGIKVASACAEAAAIASRGAFPIELVRGDREAIATEKREADRALADLEAQSRSAAKASETSERTRKRVADLREQARLQLADVARMAPHPATIDDLHEQRAGHAAELEQHEHSITRLQAQISEIEQDRQNTRLLLAEIESQIGRLAETEAAAQKANDDAIEKQARAEELEASIAESTAPSEEARRAAQARADALMVEGQTAAQLAVVVVLELQLQSAKAEAAAAEAKRAALDASEKALKHDAPKALLAASGGVPGLTVDGDTIRLDGVALDTLSGAEQLRFSVDIARRMNAKSKLLVIDKLEAVAPDQLADFIAHATADGYQLIATRVAEGPAIAKPIGGAS